MITSEQYYMGRDVQYPPTEQQKQNAITLLEKVNALEDRMTRSPLKWADTTFELSSGYRPGHFNKDAGGAKASTHLSCQAIDLKDPTGNLAAYLMLNSKLLEELGLYMEHPSYTKGWVHLQIRPTKRRIFIPY